MLPHEWRPSRDDFFETASQPEFQDRMQFQISKTKRDKDATFSKEALRDLVNNVEAFVLARISGEWKRRNIAPQDINVEVKISFTPKSAHKLANDPMAWWQAPDTYAGMPSVEADSLDLVDGEHRGGES